MHPLVAIGRLSVIMSLPIFAFLVLNPQSILCNPGDRLETQTTAYREAESGLPVTRQFCEIGDGRTYDVDRRQIVWLGAGLLLGVLGLISLDKGATHAHVGRRRAELNAALNAGLITQEEYATKLKDFRKRTDYYWREEYKPVPHDRGRILFLVLFAFGLSKTRQWQPQLTQQLNALTLAVTGGSLTQVEYQAQRNKLLDAI